MHEGEGGAVVYLPVSKRRLICITTNTFRIFSLHILAKSLMLCKCQVWDFFWRFKFNICCCFASLKHINNGGGGGGEFFTGLNKNIKLSELIAILECIELKSTGGNFASVAVKKEQIKSLPATWNRCWNEPAAAESNHSGGPPWGSPPRRRCTCCFRPPAPWSASSTRGTLSHSGGP